MRIKTMTTVLAAVAMLGACGRAQPPQANATSGFVGTQDANALQRVDSAMAISPAETNAAATAPTAAAATAATTTTSTTAASPTTASAATSHASSTTAAADTGHHRRHRRHVVKHTKRDAVIGGVAGAALGAATSHHKVRGAVVGGAIGAAAGAIIGNNVDKSRRP